MRSLSMSSKSACSVAYWRTTVMKNLLSAFKQYCCPLNFLQDICYYLSFYGREEFLALTSSAT